MNFKSPSKKEWGIGATVIIGAVLVSWVIISEPYSKWFGPKMVDERGNNYIPDNDIELTQPQVSQEPVTLEEVPNSTLRAYLSLKDKSLVSFGTKLKDGLGTVVVCGGSYEDSDYPGGSFHLPYEDSSETCAKDQISRSIEVALDLKTLKAGKIEMAGYGSGRYPYENTAIAGVLTVKYAGNTERFLLLFGTSRYDNGVSVFSESFGESLGDLIVDSINFEDGIYLVLNAHSPSGQQISTPFLIEGPARNADAPRIVKLTSDRKSKIYEDYLLSFSYPISLSTQHRLWYGYQSRYQDYKLKEMEKINSKSPIYYSGACGQEPSLGDISFGFYGDLDRNLSAHFISSPTAYLTTAPYGYDPNEWGKVIGSLDVTTYAKWIQDGVKIPGKNVEILNIGGYTVRRIIMNEEQPRPCDNVKFEQYQWVQDGVLLNLISSARGEEETDPPSDQALIKQVIGSLEVK